MPGPTVVARRALARILGPDQIEEANVVYALLRNERGVLIEVGAHNGDETFRRFAADGWTIHAFEPDPDNRTELARVAGSLSNVTIVPQAVADKPGTMTLYGSAESSGISSLVAFTPGHEARLEVDVVRLADYLPAAGIDHVDFLKIDVEGYERFVMKGYPWDTHRPRAVLLEFEDRKTAPLGYRWSDLADDLVGHGYAVLVSEWFPIVRYGVTHRWRRYATYPTELVDPNAWGNLIAVQTQDFGRLRRAAMLQAVRFKTRQRLRPHKP